ncbi:MAG: PD-(D/E)XK nuclease family protein [Oscillospiraceae bacterium]|nr:PD-(D/E)XK nuclease family protein [Oscillospiraceae bacterium]
MLKLILGRAKSGKTSRIMNEISALLADGCKGITFIVPEQYSHEAECELLRVCGDSLSLGAEVLSFTRLYTRVCAELGGEKKMLLDKGGKLLSMVLALDAVGSRLTYYASARRQAELQMTLLSAIDELKSALITPDELMAFAGARTGDSLGTKMTDLALIYSAYNSIVASSGLDPSDRLALLTEKLPDSEMAHGTYFVDGFIDFTRQQEEIIRTLLRCGANVTVCLTADSLEESHEIFEPSRRAAVRLQRIAESLGIGCEITYCTRSGEPSAMQFLEKELFAFSDAQFEGDAPVTLVRAGSLTAECEAAAAHCLRLVRENGCRWRDIAIAVRNFENCRTAIENVFSHYGVPLYTAKRSDIMDKSISTLISAAFEIITSGWGYEDMFTYLKTGLCGLTVEECDKLENYVFLWSKRGSAWTNAKGWSEHPDGWGCEYTDETIETLREINSLRRRVAAPLHAFYERGRAADTAAGQAQALAAFFEDLNLAERLSQHAAELDKLGMEREAAEYEQLWDLIIAALEQCASMLGDAQMDTEAFGKLFCLVLSQYDIGTIPLTLDKVTAGDMDRMRSRNTKHLIILSCDSTNIPSVGAAGGLFSDADREALCAAGLNISDTAPDRLFREFSLLYSTLTLPSSSVYMSYTAASGEDGAAQPAFIMTRAANIFGKDILHSDTDSCRTYAKAPCFQLAARASKENPLTLAAHRYFAEKGENEHLENISNAANAIRGSLSREAVRKLYGAMPRLSASRIDKFASCRFQYFLQYGLGAKPRRSAEFAPPEMGTFMHFVLENVAREVNTLGGFSAVSDSEVEKLCTKYVQEYIHTELNDFSEKSPRFIYLFKRLDSTVRKVVLDTAHELARSDFKPIDFELNFGDASEFPPIQLGGGEDSMVLTGIADRIDGWLHEGKLYLRVVDYKTGQKKFSLSDIWYGLGLQMLLYLFALGETGEKRYGAQIVPAGVLYVPARDVPVSAKRNMSDEEIIAEKLKNVRRSGLVLADDSVLNAMEHSDSPMYIPVKINKSGEYSGDSIATAEQLGILARHIDTTLRSLARELRGGSIAADPYFRSMTDNACQHCEFREACLFDEAHDCKRSLKKLKNEEIWSLMQEGGETDGI